MDTRRLQQGFEDARLQRLAHLKANLGIDSIVPIKAAAPLNVVMTGKLGAVRDVQGEPMCFPAAARMAPASAPHNTVYHQVLGHPPSGKALKT